MTEYWVIGGEYRNTEFRALSPDAAQEQYGPFPSFDAAYKEWRTRNMARVDEALVHYRIIERETSQVA